jgi:hypothetical protein
MSGKPAAPVVEGWSWRVCVRVVGPRGCRKDSWNRKWRWGDAGVNVRGAMSQDGSRVFFYTEELEATGSHFEFATLHHLELRDLDGSETIVVNGRRV